MKAQRTLWHFAATVAAPMVPLSSGNADPVAAFSRCKTISLLSASARRRL